MADNNTIQMANPAVPTGVSPWLVAIVVTIAVFMEVLDTTITNVSLSHIAGTLGASADESTWVLTSYLVANGIVLPLSGWLSNALGRKRFFMGCIACFTLASFACGASTSLGMLIFFRILQGLAGGGLQPSQQAIILDAFPPHQRGAAFGITGITMIVAPILGPTLGGFLTDNYSWRWIFFINIPVGMIAIYLVNRLLVDPPHAKATGFKSIDYTGLALIIIGLGCLQIVLDKGQQEDWFTSPMIVTFALISACCIISAIIWLLHQVDPIVDLRLLKSRSFGLACVMIFFTGFVLYGSSALLPIMLQSWFGYDATLAGLVISPGGLAVIFLMPVAGKLVGRFQARYLVALGMGLCAFGMFHTYFFTPQTDYNTFVWMRITQTLGLPFLFIPISTLAFISIPKEKSNKASALYALARNLGGSVGIAIIISYVSRHSQMHQNTLAAHLSPTASNYRHYVGHITRYLTTQGNDMLSATQTALGQVYRGLIEQATLLAYMDAYLLLATIMLILTFIALLMPKNNPRQKVAPGAAH